MALDKIQLVLNEVDAQIDSQWAQNKQVKDLLLLRTACVQALGLIATTAPMVPIVRQLSPQTPINYGAGYPQSALQLAYDSVPGTAPDTVPQAVTDAANLAGGGYKLYLGSTLWWYTLVEVTISSTSWISFAKGPFGVNVAAIYTFK